MHRIIESYLVIRFQASERRILPRGLIGLFDIYLYLECGRRVVLLHNDNLAFLYTPLQQISRGLWEIMLKVIWASGPVLDTGTWALSFIRTRACRRHIRRAFARSRTGRPSREPIDSLRMARQCLPTLTQVAMHLVITSAEGHMPQT